MLPFDGFGTSEMAPRGSPYMVWSSPTMNVGWPCAVEDAAEVVLRDFGKLSTDLGIMWLSNSWKVAFENKDVYYFSVKHSCEINTYDYTEIILICKEIESCDIFCILPHDYVDYHIDSLSERSRYNSVKYKNDQFVGENDEHLPVCEFFRMSFILIIFLRGPLIAKIQVAAVTALFGGIDEQCCAGAILDDMNLLVISWFVIEIHEKCCISESSTYSNSTACDPKIYPKRCYSTDDSPVA
ncbi:hypothetical protein MG293_017508 [Ovis ammon polii]|uniref:Uncharacterized protein n=1 Tax=Ovis ammon polii TaxID=230172 RepID=A0AAD4Y2F8_OVIAM|nr:hypothetical protein MG293_017508 [Ovis ammon polii]